ncbi:MAG: hypothetical protein DMF29_00735 [Verrucomicrobia bacterium]|nr:MAG: hypothetical protein DMF29_00735 [Verrucomicrobiota bacterium]
MKTVSTFGLLVFGLAFVVKVEAASRGGGALTPVHNTTKRGAYTIETIGDTLHQAKPENTPTKAAPQSNRSFEKIAKSVMKKIPDCQSQ